MIANNKGNPNSSRCRNLTDGLLGQIQVRVMWLSASSKDFDVSHFVRNDVLLGFRPGYRVDSV